MPSNPLSSTPLKHRILAYLQGQAIRRRSVIYVVAVGSLILSGAVTAVANLAPDHSFAPAIVNLQEEVALPSYELVDSQNTPFVHEAAVRSGETVVALLTRLGVKDSDLSSFITKDSAARTVFQLLKPGTTVVATTSRQGQLFSLTIPKSDGLTSKMITRDQGTLKIQEQSLNTERRVMVVSGQIRSSLFGATDEAGLPDSTAAALVDMFGSNIDFHRDLRRGDSFNVVYEMQYYNGAPIKTGRILGAEFINKGKRYDAVWYARADGSGDYYGSDGRSLREGFLRSPLEFSRISSGFSMRFHPILKTWKEHKGTDFAAPTGTGVKAASDGVVDFVGVQNGYGNFIVLHHRDGYSTAYGHLNSIAEGLQRGQKVSQGQIIGFVGSTGWATGPHLHYEFRINDVPHDPMTVALPGANPLSGSQLADFRAKTAPVLDRLALSTRTATPVTVAQK